jgi:hypothetical protein
MRSAKSREAVNTQDKMETQGMRTSLRFLLAASLAAASTSAIAQIPVAGLVTLPDCSDLLLADTNNAELVGIKIPASGSCRDILFDFRQTGGLNAGSATTGDDSNVQWLIPPNWTNPQVGTDAHFIVMTYPPLAGQRANRVMVDSGSIANQDFTAAAVQTIGNSPPTTVAQGIGLTLVSAGSYGVRLAGQGGAVTSGFPRGANGGVEVAFAPLAEVNTFDILGGGGCTVAGETRNPSAPADPSADGAIIGYNVYRLAGTAGSPPTAQNYYDASINATADDGWQYFMPISQSYNLTATDNLTLGGPTPPAASDMNPNDLGGLQNPDGVMSSGDEVLIFQDSAANRGVARVSGVGPAGTQGYWYAIQPVLCGSMADFAASGGFGPAGGILTGNHALNLSSLGAGNDAVDLDLNGSPEFFSPQADVGSQPGLGLTYDGLPAISEPVFGSVNPAPAAGRVSLAGRLDGQTVALTIQGGLEGDIKGYNVLRGTGASAVRVNEQLILASGNESSVYQLVDDAAQARRLSRGGTVQYSVEIVHQDDSTTVAGPFTVTLDRNAPSGRRSR